MGELPFSSDLIRFLFDARTDLLTRVFSFFTFLGEIGGYVLLISFVFAVWDKQLAFRLAALTLVTMSLNHLLKSLIMNPRPFVAEGTYAERWAVSPQTAQELAAEYSTPSGHAMAGAAFYTYAYASLGNRALRIACILLILLTGLSRPYLGVHYLEDVLIGWGIGAAIAVFAFKYARQLGELWGRLTPLRQIGIVAAASLLLCLLTRALEDPNRAAQPLAFVSYTGFLMGIVVAHPLEARHVGFDPRSASVLRKALRFALCVALVMGTLLLLDGVFAALSDDGSVLGILLRYLRYALAGVAGMFVGPLVFVKLGWAERARDVIGFRSAGVARARADR